MHIPLHIRQRPRRLRAWLRDRHDTLAAFERLTGKGLSPRQAATALGLTPAGVQALRESLEELAGEGTRLQTRSPSERLDLDLSCAGVPNVRKGLRSRVVHPEHLCADDLEAERAGGVHRAWRMVRRWRWPYRRQPTLATLA